MFFSLLSYALSPVQKGDFQALGDQLEIVPKALARAFMAGGMLPHDYLPSPVAGGKLWQAPKLEEGRRLSIRGVLVDATGGYCRWLKGIWGAGTSDAAEPGFLVWFGAGLEGLAPHWRTIFDRTSLLLMSWIGFLALLFAVLWTMGKGFVETAHAAETPSLPPVPSPTNATVANDIALSLLAQLFGGLGSTGGLLSTLCGSVLTILGAAAFTIAALSALLHGVVMVVDYVVEPDTFKQKHDPVWLYIRAAIALMLVFPISNGYGGGQAVFLWGASQGSKLATKAWANASSLLTSTNLGNLVVPPGSPQVNETVASLFLSNVCLQAVAQGPHDSSDLAIHKGPPGYGGSAGTNTKNSNTANFAGNVTTFDLYHSSGVLAVGGMSYCGSFTLPQVVNTGSSTVNSALQTGLSWLPAWTPFVGNSAYSAKINIVQINDFGSMQASVAKLARDFVAHTNPDVCDVTGVTCVSPESYSSQLSSIMASYQSGLSADLQNLLPETTTAAVTTMQQSMSKGGWVAAGLWAFQLSQVNGSLSQQMNNPPTVQNPTNRLSGDARDSVAMARSILPTAGIMSGQGIPDFGSSPSVFTSLVRWLFAPDIVGIENMNPIAGISTTGDNFITMGATLLALDLAVNGENPAIGASKGGLSAGEGVLEKLPGAGMILQVLSTATDATIWAIKSLHTVLPEVSILLVIVGCGLAYICPMLPMLHFIFSVLGWLIAVIECVVLVPIMFVLMVSSQGGGLLSPMAKSCFWICGACIIRPLIAITGFLFGLSLAIAFLTFLNAFLLPAFASSNEWGVSFFFTYVVVYFVIVYAVMNTCSKMPDTLVHASYRWLGANAGGERDDLGAAMVGIAGMGWKISSGLGRLRPQKSANR